MLRLASLRRLLLCLFIAGGLTSLSACGRSSLLSGSPSDCPGGLVNADGTCLGDGGLPDGFHDLGDGFTDCQTCATQGCDKPGCCACSACKGALFCQNMDMKGDGGDGGDPCATKADCTKPECLGDPRCHVLGTEVCNNGVDDDDNGLIDCADPACSTFPGCKIKTCPTPPDCTLPICVDDPACKDLKCHPSVDFGTLQPTNSSSTKTVNTTGTMDVVPTPCAPGGGGMVVTRFTLTGTADVALSYMQAKGEDHVFGLFRAGVNQPCNSNPVTCYDPKGATSGTTAFPQLEPGEYYVIAQAFTPAAQGSVTVTLSTPSTPEICNNGIDDNGNGLIDCAEASCASAPNCANQECSVDINLGALVVNGPGKSTSFTTTTADANNTLTCQGAPGGGDVVVRFTLQETAGILVDWSQSGDHVLALVALPAPGQPCDVNQISCYDPSGRPMDSVAFGEMPPGEYAIIWKALKPGNEGSVSATISAYRNRQQELCHNGIDDDGNGLIDCQDPACIGVEGCSAPYCQPNVNFGTMMVGDSKTTNLDIKTNGQAGYVATCSKGGAKGMVVQMTVAATGGVAIGFDCTETGDHVLALYQAGGPRDKCDFNELVCADPKILPFGCGYAVPNLDPGTYNIIAEGYQPGSEGTMNLTLSVLDDRVLEICNNGIDDDKDGKTDCQDRKCATNPLCAATACRPDDIINPMPLTGMNVFRLVQTANNGTQANVPCATTAGGQTSVIAITLTAAANLHLQWNQIGNHDFAVYTDDGKLLPCDAGTLVTCGKSNNAPNGTLDFNNVPQGTVYVIIAGDQPDTMATQYSGSVSIALSGTPAP
jgi:hypothetical protein